MKGKIRIVTTLLLLIVFALAMQNVMNDANAQSSGDGVFRVENLADLFNVISEISGKFTNHLGDVATITAKVVGEESVGGNDCWKVLVTYEVGDTVTNATLWISKATGLCVKAKIDDTILTGDFAQAIGVALLDFWLSWIQNFWITWSYEKLMVWYYTYDYGSIVFLGTETRTYGPTSLVVYKYKFFAHPSVPDEFRWNVEGWVAPTQFGGILVYLYAEHVGFEEWFKWELTSIALREPQELPKLQFSSLTISSQQVEPNEEFTVSINITNTGGTFAFYNATLLIDGELVDSMVVLINAGESKIVSFTTKIESEGEHVIELCGKSKTIYVGITTPANFEVSNLNVNPSTVTVGEEVTISVLVKNAGGSSGSYTVTLKVNGDIIDSKQVTLNAGESTTVTFKYTANVEGKFTVEIDGLTSSFTVNPKEQPPQEPTPTGPPFELIGVAVVVVALAAILAVYFTKIKK